MKVTLKMKTLNNYGKSFYSGSIYIFLTLEKSLNKSALLWSLSLLLIDTTYLYLAKIDTRTPAPSNQQITVSMSKHRSRKVSLSTYVDIKTVVSAPKPFYAKRELFYFNYSSMAMLIYFYTIVIKQIFTESHVLYKIDYLCLCVIR